MKSLVLAEKPSVARDLARVLRCHHKTKSYIEGDGYVVTWALGHLVTLAEPEDYDRRYREWRMEDLPMLPEEMKLKVKDHVDDLGCTLGEELIKPTRIYSATLLNLIKNFKVKGLVHITGGGIIDNIPRILPNGCKAVVEKKSWDVLPIFDFLQKNGNVSPQEMCRTFNCGIGMVVVVNDKEVDDAMQQLEALGEKPYLIGEIAKRKKKDAMAVEVDCG